MTDFEMDEMYTNTGREPLALLSMIPDGDEEAKVIVENVAGRKKSAKVNESQIDFLKPCPFCGCTDIMVWRISHIGLYAARCPNCITYGPKKHSEEEAAASWNGRVKE